MANDEFDNSRTDKEMLERLQPVCERDDDILHVSRKGLIDIWATMNTTAFMMWIPLVRRLKDGSFTEYDQSYLMPTACSAACAVVNLDQLMREHR